MMESQSPRPPRDPNRVTLEDKTDLLYWTDRFSVSEAACARALTRSGTMWMRLPIFSTSRDEHAGPACGLIGTLHHDKRGARLRLPHADPDSRMRKMLTPS